MMMELRITHFISILLFFSSSPLVTSLPDSSTCTTNLTLINSTIPFSTTSLHCHPVWPSQDFILRYSQHGPELWSFVLSAPNTNAYIAIGFSPTGKMVGSSAMVGWLSVNGSGVGVIKQYYLNGSRVGEVVPDEGKLMVVRNSTAVIYESGQLHIAFQLNTKQPESRLIYSVGQKDRIPTNRSFLMQHRAQVSTLFNYDSGILKTETSYITLRRSHGILNILGWGITMLIGAMTARHLKPWDPIWFYSHTLIQCLAFLLGASGVIMGFVLEDFLNVAVDRHKTLGIFILLLACLQVIALLFRPSKASKVRKFWNWYHTIVGRVLVILSIANIFYGIHVGHERSGWNIGYGVALGILVIVAVGLEVRMWRRK